MRRRELLAGVGSLGVLGGATAVVLGGFPPLGTEGTASTTDGGSEWPIEIETIDARGSEAGTVTVPNGDVTVVMFFVTGCGNCQAQVPRLAEARTRLVEAAGDGPTFLSVTYQSAATMPADELRTWWRTHGGHGTVGYDPDSALAANYRIVGYPVTAVIDGRGEKRWEALGRASAEAIVGAVESVLEADDEASNAPSETGEPSSNASTVLTAPPTSE